MGGFGLVLIRLQRHINEDFVCLGILYGDLKLLLIKHAHTCALLHFAGINLSVVAALAVVIGACAVGMGYMAWLKKKEISARKYIPLFEDLQN